MSSRISPAEASARLQSSPSPILLDVRHPERHAQARPEPAVSNCVFEVAFLPRMPEIGGPQSAIFLLGEDGDSGEAAAASAKLLRAGYTDVSIIAGGFAAWREAGLPVTGSGDPVASAPWSGTLPVDIQESRVEWTGRNLLNKHWGTVAVRDGELHFADGQLCGGRVVLDMLSLACTDLAGSPLHDVLIAHLADDDFFDTSRFPTATLEISQGASPLHGPPGGPNLRVSGQLELRGVTKPLVFDACAGWTPDGRAAAQAAFSIDRTDWGVLYGSGKFFRHLAGHLVNDRIDFQVRLVTRPA